MPPMLSVGADAMEPLSETGVAAVARRKAPASTDTKLEEFPLPGRPCPGSVVLSLQGSARSFCQSKLMSPIEWSTCNVSAALAAWLGRAGPLEPLLRAETATRRGWARTPPVRELCIRVMRAVALYYSVAANSR